VVRLTRLRQREVVLNAELIKTVEASPDTLITLTSGETMLVEEPVEVVVEAVLEYRRRLLQPWSGQGADGR
jgi:flagellar protein FlbD